jgi:inosose dehydratase
MGILIGSAPDSWGVWFADDALQTPWHRFLDEIKEAGYRWLELGPYGYLPSNAVTLRRELQCRGLGVTGGSIAIALEDASARAELESQIMKTGELLAEVGTRYLVLIDGYYTDPQTGAQTAPARLDEGGWQRLIDATHRAADIASRRFGLRLVFHPHADTHVQYQDEIERFLASTDPERVSLCLDTGHHAYAGGDPVMFMRKHHRRIPYLHLKSVDKDLQVRAQAEQLPFAKAVRLGVFCEPSAGAVNFRSFGAMLREIGFDGWGIVEQDMYPAPFDKPLPIAKRTRAYFQEVGMA